MSDRFRELRKQLEGRGLSSMDKPLIIEALTAAEERVPLIKLVDHLKAELAAIKTKLEVYETALDNIDRYGMPEQYEQRTASEALAAGKLKTG